ncbi:hypothetical protein [Allochromatium vinosum]|uniref:hypothetical protein n=1 Tax=Allochromatium vinosum TaxID=1049 RepID=UPI0011D15FDD|nr:hypothetical protein [Allochromatium vinosum]
MALPYGEYSDKAFEVFSRLTDESAKRIGARSLLLCSVSGTLSIWNTGEKGEYKGKQKIVYEARPDEDDLYLDEDEDADDYDGDRDYDYSDIHPDETVDEFEDHEDFEPRD